MTRVYIYGDGTMPEGRYVAEADYDGLHQVIDANERALISAADRIRTLEDGLRRLRGRLIEFNAGHAICGSDAELIATIDCALKSQSETKGKVCMQCGGQGFIFSYPNNQPRSIDCPSCLPANRTEETKGEVGG
jgi:hypothetical protein